MPHVISATVAAKIGSIIVHVEEGLSLDGHRFDWVALQTLIADPEVQAWLKELGPMVPRKRRG